MLAKKTTTRAPAQAKVPPARLTLAEAMSALEKAGSAQTRKTYARHGASGPMFGVSFAFLKTLVKRIGVDQELARALWDTGNFDARMLAVKVADPAKVSSADLDRWARAPGVRMCFGYLGTLVAEGPHARAKAGEWLAAKSESVRCVAWSLVAAMAMTHENTPDTWFAEHLATIEKSIHSVPNAEREAMNQALIAIGCRSATLRKSAISAARRIGKVKIDHGDTACKTPDAAQSIEKAWAYAKAKNFDSPAAQERRRESIRIRC